MWQALAFLDGRAAIDWPVPGFPRRQRLDAGRLPPERAHRRDVRARSCRSLRCRRSCSCRSWRSGASRPTSGPSRSLLGAIDVGLAWWALGRLPRLAPDPPRDDDLLRLRDRLLVRGPARDDLVLRPRRRAHVPPARDRASRSAADPEADDEVEDAAASRRRSCASVCAAARARPLALIDRRQFLAGLLFGIACTARLTVVFGAPFFMLVGGGGTWLRRSVSAGLGAIIPVGAAARLQRGDDRATSSTPATSTSIRRRRTATEPSATTRTGRIEDPRYLPQNLAIMFLSTPGDPAGATTPSAFGETASRCARRPDAARGLFDERLPDRRAPRRSG